MAVDVEAGKELWRLETNVSLGSAPVADSTHVYLTTADGRLLAVDAHDGRLVGQTRPRMGTDSDKVAADLTRPVIADGHVYASARHGTVFAVDGAIRRAGDTPKGRPLGRRPFAVSPQPSLLTSRTAPLSALVAIAA